MIIKNKLDKNKISRKKNIFFDLFKYSVNILVIELDTPYDVRLKKRVDTDNIKDILPYKLKPRYLAYNKFNIKPEIAFIAVNEPDFKITLFNLATGFI